MQLPSMTVHKAGTLPAGRVATYAQKQAVSRRALFGCIPIIEQCQSAQPLPLKLTQGMRAAVQIWQGSDAMAMPIRIPGRPGSLYVQYALSDRARAQIEQQLPASMVLAPVQTTQATNAKPQLTLNMYNIESSVINGTRMELSTYVTLKHESNRPQPYYMILKAWSSQLSYDPSRGLTIPDQLRLNANGDALRVNLFKGTKSEMQLEFQRTSGISASSAQWALANERCYWLNGDFDNIEETAVFLDQAFSPLKLTKVQGRLPFIEALDQPLEALISTTDMLFCIRPEL